MLLRLLLALGLSLSGACSHSQGREMAHRPDVRQLLDELIDAYKFGEQARATALVAQLGNEPQEARAVLEAMLEDSYGLARQASVFGLGVLGGVHSVQRLGQQLAVEEARGDYDGEAVVEEIVDTLGRIEEDGARELLVRRLERVTTGNPAVSDVNSLASSLWRKRHPDLVPIVRRNLERLSLPARGCLGGLAELLERSPEELRAWVLDLSVPVKLKTEVVYLFEHELPSSFLPTLPALISVASTLLEGPVGHQSQEEDYWEHLLTLLLLNRERLVALPVEVRSELRALAINLVAASRLNCSVRAATMLKFVGRSEDAAVIEANRPAHPDLAKDFDELAQAVRDLQKH